MGSHPIFSGELPKEMRLSITTNAIAALDELNRKAYRRGLFREAIAYVVLTLLGVAAFVGAFVLIALNGVLT